MITIIANREFDMDQFPSRDIAAGETEDIGKGGQGIQRNEECQSGRHVHAVQYESHEPFEVQGPQCSVLLLTGASERELDDAVLQLAAGNRGVEVIRYWVENDTRHDGALFISRSPGVAPESARSRIGDDGALAEGGRVRLHMDDCCLTCTIKHDAGMMMTACAEGARVLLVVLPPSIEASPVVAYLREQCAMSGAFADMLDVSEAGKGVDDDSDGEERREALAVQGIVTVARSAGMCERLFDDAPCVFGEGIEDPGDDRSSGGMTIRLIQEADHLVMLDDAVSSGDGLRGLGVGPAASAADADADGVMRELLSLLLPVGGAVHTDMRRVSLQNLAPREKAEETQSDAGEVNGASGEAGGGESLVREVAPGSSDGTSIEDGEAIEMKAFGRHILALSVRTQRPVHPARLSDYLGSEHEAMHIQAHFKVPTKPFSTFVWECEPNGSQVEQIPDVYLGDVHCNVTELFMIVRCDDVNRDGASIARGVEDLLLDDAEMALDSVAWMGQEDDFTHWAESASVGDDEV
jgi:hypothetical protein